MPSPWLPVVILVVVGVAFALLTRQVARRIGRSPNRFGSGDIAHDLVGRIYRVSGGSLLVFLIARAIVPELDAAVGLIPVLARPGITWLGLTIMLTGSAVILAAQVQMGASWRIGLDQERTGLVTSGPFAWSRNPTFLGMVTVLLGAFLAAPTAVMGIVLAGTAVWASCCGRWVAFLDPDPHGRGALQHMHRLAYDRYALGVPRWIGLPSICAGSLRSTAALWITG
jgi:protein-S-isoprenylcysteine O-methyltransferase Ste14